MVIKTKKRKKASRMMGTRTHGQGAMKRGSGHRGGVGMSGTGKRADHKKSLILKLYGSKYFGKQGITSKRTAKRKLKTINIRKILEKFVGKSNIDLSKYKILGDGEISHAITIKAKAFTKSAKDKIEKAGGKIIVPEVKVKEVKKQIEKSDIDTEKKEKSE